MTSSQPSTMREALEKIHNADPRNSSLWWAQEVARVALSVPEAQPGEAEQLLRELLTGYDGGHIKIDSPEIGGELSQGFDDPGTAPHSWHEEWIYHVRALLAGSKP